jgi:hypothetical protein
VRHQLNTGVGLAADDGPRPQNHHADLALVHAVGCGQSALVDRCVPVVAMMDECII